MSTAPAHVKRSENRHWTWIIATLIVVIIGLVTGGVVLFTSSSSTAKLDARLTPIAPLQVVSTNPTTGASSVAPETTLSVTFSTPLAANSPMPTLAPSIPGTWEAASATELEFISSEPLAPGASETLTIPGGQGGMLSAQGKSLAASDTVGFTVAQGSVLRLQQLLAELGYLPVMFYPTTQPTSPAQEADVQQGTFAWRWANQPVSLTSLWSPGTYNEMTKAAVMAFEDQHGLKTDGESGPAVWTALLQAAAAGQSDDHAYPYVYVTEDLPETVTVYQNGSVTYTTLANTGVSAVPTQQGTFAVYERFLTTTMSGTNPDGSKYVDPGIPWVSYFNGGDALHGYVRGSYGFPQSDGCVEMPPANAEVVYPQTPIGTLVTVA